MKSNNPTRKQWKLAYELADPIKQMQPWRSFWEREYLGFINPFTEEPAFISLMGRGGEHFAVAVYPDAASLYRMHELSTNESLDPLDLMFVPHFQLSFENRDMVEKEDRAVMKELGRTYRGRFAWPIFRTYDPGFIPWFITQKKLELLCRALYLIGEELPRYAAQLSTIELDTRFDESCEVFMLDTGTEDAFRVIDRPAEKRIDPELDFSTIAVAKGWKPIENIIEFDMSFLPMPVDDYERPYFPSVLMAVVEDAGMIVGFSMLQPIPDYSSMLKKLPSAFLESLSSHGVIPHEVLVRNKQVFHALKPLASAIGFKLSIRDHLPAAKEALDSMLDMPPMG